MLSGAGEDRLMGSELSVDYSHNKTIYIDGFEQGNLLKNSQCCGFLVLDGQRFSWFYWIWISVFYGMEIYKQMNGYSNLIDYTDRKIGIKY